jgi:hypothetical protein
MIWLKLIAYYAVCAVVLIGALEGFIRGCRLRFGLPRSAGLVVVVPLLSLLFVALGCVFFLPILLLGFVLGDAHSIENIRFVGVLGYLASMLIAGLFVKHRHPDSLKSLGYYK